MQPMHHISVLKNPSHLNEKDKNRNRDEQLEELNDKYVRLMAEFENYKRRSERERSRLVEAADEELIKELIEIPDNFDRAFRTNKRGDTFVDGMKLNYTTLIAILKKHGLEAYGELEDKFDPELHEACMCAPNRSIPESHITAVLERGYTLKGKIIKHAKVAVSSGNKQ